MSCSRYVVSGERVTAALAALAATFIAVASAQPNEAAVTLRIESPGQPGMEMQYFVGADRLRMDLGTGASMVWFGGATQRMLMIQHAEKRYMDWGPDQLKLMQQMMQRLPQAAGAGANRAAIDPQKLTFRETGRRDKVGSWDAFEVEVTGLPQGQTGSLWMTTDVETGMFELFARLGEAMSALQMPMLGAASPGQELTRYRELATASGIPSGHVVRIVSTENGRASTITLMSVKPGPLPAETFAAPAGYQKMEMPAIPGN
jgi:hypothetical protein